MMPSLAFTRKEALTHSSIHPEGALVSAGFDDHSEGTLFSSTLHANFTPIEKRYGPLCRLFCVVAYRG